MTLKQNIAALLGAGVTVRQFKETLREVEDERLVIENDADMPDMPTLPPAIWAALKANLRSTIGPTNKFDMLKMGHEALDEDDQKKLFRALRGMFNAVWAEHAGFRRRGGVNPA